MEEFIDLHSHTVYSDGTKKPYELVQLAKELGLRAIAVTDHDTVAGIQEAMEAGAKIGVEVIPGTELSIEYPLPDHGHMHILGLFLDIESPELAQGLNWLRTMREERTPRILKKLAEHGLEISEEDIRNEAGEGSVGRPHIARIMVRKGFVSSMQEAFDQYLKKGAVAYVPKDKFALDKALKMITEAGGLPILAHPFSLKLDDTVVEELVASMKEKGLKGLEAHYSNHTPEQTAIYTEIANKHGLLISGGSDFHGENKPDIKLGTGLGDLQVPYSHLEKMKQELTN
jgi:3',5'-nucleoside bisphosphate phosphatase